MSRLTACIKIATLVCAGLTVLLSSPTLQRHSTVTRRSSSRCCRMPGVPSVPEGLAVAPNGDVYVATFDGSKKIFVFNDNGRLLRTLTVNASSGALLEPRLPSAHRRVSR